jgi:hypothetical protein
MGVEGAGGINPEYATRVATAEAATSAQGVANVFGQGFSMTSPNRATMLAVSFSRFVARDIHTWLVSVACVVAAGVAILDLGSRRSARHAPVSRLALVVAVALAGAVAASTTWSLLMPHHAVFHAHFLHRHLLVGLALPGLHGLHLRLCGGGVRVRWLVSGPRCGAMAPFSSPRGCWRVAGCRVKRSSRLRPTWS